MTAGSRPRLLFLCQNLPYPPDGGALIRSYHTLRLLARDFDVTALCFVRRSTRPSSEAIEAARVALEDTAERVEVFELPQERSRLRFVADHLSSVLSGRAYTRWAYESGAFRTRLRELLKAEPFDLVHVDSLDLVGYLPLLTGQPLVVAHHNVESQLLRRRADSESGLRGMYLRRQARLLEREERRWCPRVDLNVVVSPEDADTLAALAPAAEVMVVPNGVDSRAFSPSDEEPRREIVFVGGYTWFPNREGMEYFAVEILPLIRDRDPDVPVTWVGRAPEEIRQAFAGRGVTLTGYVEDIRPYVTRAACFVVPLRVGGGTRLKILDAWSMGKAVVSTSAGSEGLAVRPGENMLVADEPESFAAAVLRVLDDTDLRQALGSEARATAESLYDWDVIGGPMLERYAVLVSRERV